jgi:putative glutathione S-transferase
MCDLLSAAYDIHAANRTLEDPMGMLVNGVWQDIWYDTKTTGGAFVRPQTSFRSLVEDAPGARFAPEPGRYILYVARACPWAHRVVLVRALKGLEDAVPLAVVDPLMLEQGWAFSDYPGCTPDPVLGARYLHELYAKAQPNYTGRVSVPLLWDTHEQTLVNNESAELMRMFNLAFDRFATRPLPDLYPQELRGEIDAINARVYAAVNDGVYRAGFATAQDKYEAAVHTLFETLDELEQRLSTQRWLVSEVLTEADLRLYTTLIRFDAVYHGHFKCNVRRITDYPHLSRYLKRIHELPHVAETFVLEHVKRHYYGSHRGINPSGIVPVGPAVILA